MGRYLVSIGVFLLLCGLLVQFGPALGVKFGDLPGDVRVKSGTGEFYFPLTTCLILSVATSAVLWLLRRLF